MFSCSKFYLPKGQKKLFPAKDKINTAENSPHKKRKLLPVFDFSMRGKISAGILFGELT